MTAKALDTQRALTRLLSVVLLFVERARSARLPSGCTRAPPGPPGLRPAAQPEGSSLLADSSSPFHSHPLPLPSSACLRGALRSAARPGLRGAGRVGAREAATGQHSFLGGSLNSVRKFIHFYVPTCHGVKRQTDQSLRSNTQLLSGGVWGHPLALTGLCIHSRAVEMAVLVL